MAVSVSGGKSGNPSERLLIEGGPIAGDGEQFRLSAERGAAGREAAGSSRLDIKAINGSKIFKPEDELVLIGCKCRSWCCAKCGPGYFARIGSKIMPSLGIFKKPRLLTLTIDRKRYESGQEAYSYIQSEGLLRRFLRLSGFKKAFSILAFHPKAPDWPHWHLLVDLADCGSWVDRENMWALWRDKWGCGGLDLELSKDRGPATAAARYALGYCQHQAGIVAPWVLEATRLPRVFETYGELRAAIRDANKLASGAASDSPAGDQAASDGSAADSPGKTRSQSTRTVRERLGDCGSGSTVLLKRHGPGGRSTYTFKGSVAVSPGRFALADATGELKTLDVKRHVHTLPNGEEKLRVSVPLGKLDAKSMLGKLEREARTLHMADVEEQGGGSPELEGQAPAYGESSLEDQKGGDDVAPF